MNNNMKIEFLSISQNEKFARSVVSAFVSQLNPTLDELEDIKASVSEAVTNAIVHGYKNTLGIIYISCKLCDNTATIIIKDDGCGIENLELARTPLYTSSQDSERSGLGFTVMETFMDEIDVVSESNIGTTITLIKQIHNDVTSNE